MSDELLTDKELAWLRNVPNPGITVSSLLRHIDVLQAQLTEAQEELRRTREALDRTQAQLAQVTRERDVFKQLVKDATAYAHNKQGLCFCAWCERRKAALKESP